MIMRIFQVRTRPGKEAEFAEFFHNTAIPLMKGTEGIVQVLAGAPHDDPRNFSVVMVWRDLAALSDFVGDDYRAPHIDPAEDDLVESRMIHHYELA
ncbi:antibiotic biosynthesis monooxygenase family protein [Thiosulfatihalobacter marinus]|uniref:antibiotic biosynthesis monooxygenase family protein n=1 Tax=Thiosulfatihalobacter marinus TaxID=2792481 RepID=UPI0018D6F7A2|nr:antibiotic biosynthesis monooxygenase [Thiosulfatihalobacter marinus]